MKKLWVMLSLLAALGAMSACDDNDDRKVEVPAAVESAFERMFPQVAKVDWSDRGGYLVARFTNAGTGTQAWFDTDGSWRMTEEDLDYAALPAAVKTAFETGEYAAWRVDEADLLLREGLEKVYVLEVEKGGAEYELFYSEQGILLRAVPDTDGDDDNEDMLPEELPAAVMEFLSEHYPQAGIVDAERERGRIEVEILDGRTPRELLFTESGEWVSTCTEVRKADVPAVVLATLSASQYGAWEIDEIDHYVSPDDEWYVFDLENEATDQEHKLKIRSDGTTI